MSSIGSNQSSKRWELVSIAECESSDLLLTFFIAWSPGRRFNAGDSRLITTETTPPSLPTNPATGPSAGDPAGSQESCAPFWAGAPAPEATLTYKLSTILVRISHSRRD